MNSYERTPYYEQVRAEYTACLLGEQSGYVPLCVFCRYFNTSPPDYETGEVDASCEHPLEHDHPPDANHPYWRHGSIPFEEAAEGGDCWGFRPVWGAACKLPRPTHPAAGATTRKPVRVPGARLVELIDMGAEKQEELVRGKYNWQED